jgi:hypothetical protein
MYQVRDILGHVAVDIAQRQRKCHRSRGTHAIARGEPCLVIHSGDYGAGKNYCRGCAREILTKASTRLLELQGLLGL